MKHAVLLVTLCSSAVSAAEPVQFSRDVLPLLSAHCFACHGPDEHERQAELRLDLEAEAKLVRDGSAVIVPGNPEQSRLIARLLSPDPDVVMPPPKSNKRLKPEQIETLRRWVAEGARWQRHWSFEPVVKPAGTLDEAVKTGLAQKGLALRPAAAPETLVRRLSLDLIGLPPSPAQAEAFARDPSPSAYARLVDELLAQPQFGEHWGRMWLDLARYADTKGYEKDLGRTMWPWRDWVVNALNADMPLTQFTIEQLAGDLLPNPTEQQLIATAMHRNTMSNDEGGTDDEEFRTVAVKDRVDTTIQVWMGLTMGCAKCHTHKYDPISNAEYYRFYALFNQTEDADRYDDAPRIPVVSPEQRAEQVRLAAQVKRLEEEVQRVSEADADLAATEEAKWSRITVVTAEARSGATLAPQDDGSLLAKGKLESEDTYTITFTPRVGRLTAIRLEALPTKLADGQLGVGRKPADPNFVVSELTVELLTGDATQTVPLVAPRADFSQEGWPIAAAIDGDLKTGWAVSPRQRERHVAMFDFAEPLEITADSKLRVTLTQNYGDRLVLAQFRCTTSEAAPSGLMPPKESAEARKALDELAAAQKSLRDFEASLPQLPILRELPAGRQRVTKIHQRGSFLDLGEEVSGDVLSAFGKLPDGSPRNRLGAAQWLVSADNPLTPRVWANRIWARLFGLGIVESEEDFGALGTPPSHPALLDWLAAEYRDRGWSLKSLIRTIVLSETYRQASEITPDVLEADPRNVLMSRGARFRLSAEVIRDQSLAVAGLLSLRRGGPSVMPPQPAGLWRSTYNGQKWIDAEGEDRYRRGLYTYLKRTTPYPTLMTFDGGSGEVCQVRRIRTNTPLQALVTLNDPVYLEAAAALARRMVISAPDAAARAANGLRLALIRPIHAGETEPLLRLQHEAQVAFEASPEQAEAFIKASRGHAEHTPPAEFAAWIVTASAVLNLDEFLTRN
ncbi:MAG: PSD1 and planctomycete cytochrome C domain-containing protein [Planctomycetaceae bacterium]|nr:PSD1 and planctomycete cytochrome C domain-containing protein [Planctomycetaceae bacterium]